MKAHQKDFLRYVKRTVFIFGYLGNTFPDFSVPYYAEFGYTEIGFKRILKTEYKAGKEFRKTFPINP